jgi:UPF0176 protein
MTHLVIAFYTFTPIEDPEGDVARHKVFFEGREIRSRIYISKEGINGQMSATLADGNAYMEWLRQDTRFCAVDFKVQTHHEHVFPRPTVKVREQLVAIDVSIDLSQRGEYLSPEEWREELERENPDRVVLDVRNDYEWEIGHFAGAEKPGLGQFRDFPAYARELKARVSPDTTKVLMYCTGGIRCELYSALLRQEGFEHIYQLQGGVLKYGSDVGSAHWKGKLFVFDDRLAVPIAEGESGEIIGSCRFCDQKTDLYYNCANPNCNDLFLSCLTCAEERHGCCTPSCREVSGVRPFVSQERPKPYRRIVR